MPSVKQAPGESKLVVYSRRVTSSTPPSAACDLPSWLAVASGPDRTLQGGHTVSHYWPERVPPAACDLGGESLSTTKKLYICIYDTRITHVAIFDGFPSAARWPEHLLLARSDRSATHSSILAEHLLLSGFCGTLTRASPQRLPPPQSIPQRTLIVSPPPLSRTSGKEGAEVSRFTPDFHLIYS
jgi:hypothetical protein